MLGDDEDGGSIPLPLDHFFFCLPAGAYFLIISVCLDKYIVLFSKDKLLTILTSVWLLESCETEASEVEPKLQNSSGDDGHHVKSNPKPWLVTGAGSVTWTIFDWLPSTILMMPQEQGIKTDAWVKQSQNRMMFMVYNYK